MGGGDTMLLAQVWQIGQEWSSSSNVFTLIIRGFQSAWGTMNGVLTYVASFLSHLPSWFVVPFLGCLTVVVLWRIISLVL